MIDIEERIVAFLRAAPITTDNPHVSNLTSAYAKMLEAELEAWRNGTLTEPEATDATTSLHPAKKAFQKIMEPTSSDEWSDEKVWQKGAPEVEEGISDIQGTIYDLTDDTCEVWEHNRNYLLSVGIKEIQVPKYVVEADCMNTYIATLVYYIKKAGIKEIS